MTDEPTGNQGAKYTRYDGASSELDTEVRWSVADTDPFGGYITLLNHDYSLTEIWGVGLSETAGFVNKIERYSDGVGYVLWERFEFSTPLSLESVRSAIQGRTLESFLLRGADLIWGSSAGETLIGWDGNDTISGYGGADQLDGGPGNDILDGGTGADFYYGDVGNDTYYFDNGNDRAYEFAGGGLDKVISSASTVLSGNIENLTLLGSANRIGTGNSLANIIEGNTGSNKLYGMSGNDKLYGGSGHDSLTGGTGRDTMTGGIGADDFDFNSLAEIGSTSSSRDQILDFVHLVDDIDLSTIDASRLLGGNNPFTFRGTGAFTNSSSGEVRYTKINNSGTANDYTIVYIDNDADTAAEAQIYLKGLITLTSSDFIL